MIPTLPSCARSLLPPPRTLEVLERPWRPPATIGIRASGIHARSLSRATPGLSWVDQSLRRFGSRLGFRSGLRASLLIREQPRLGAEAYHLKVAGHGVTLTAADSAGLQYGLATLSQWIDLAAGEHSPSIPGVFIEDQPGFPERGAMLDVARGKRPTVEVLKALIEDLARWKFNRLQLYMEADFAFTDAHQVLQDRSPYSPREIKQLVKHAEHFHLVLVPNQQSFGHMHAWLRHEPWKHLAEVPAGVEHPFSKTKEPFSLNATDPRCLEFLGKLYDELLPNFNAGQVNVGLDETFDLGMGASHARCEELGKSQVYLEFLREVHALLAKRKQRMLYWGDIALEQPEMLPHLPRDATALVWGYEATHPFEEQLERFAASGLPFQVCPGTSSWNSLGGRISNAHGNLRRAAACAMQAGADGLLICDWGDRGHLQPWPISFFGWALGAACAWNPAQAQTVDVDQVKDWLDLWVFRDSARVMGSALLALGQTQDVLQDPCKNGTSLFFNLVFPERPLPNDRVALFPPEPLERLEGMIADALAEVPGQKSTHPNADLHGRELAFARDALLLSIRLLRARLGQSAGADWRALPANRLQPFKDGLHDLRAAHGELWGQRFRPGGLQSSLGWLDVNPDT